eukprot:754428-Hanusia_phi.AAC.1
MSALSMSSSFTTTTAALPPLLFPCSLPSSSPPLPRSHVADISQLIPQRGFINPADKRMEDL